MNDEMMPDDWQADDDQLRWEAEMDAKVITEADMSIRYVAASVQTIMDLWKNDDAREYIARNAERLSDPTINLFNFFMMISKDHLPKVS